MLVLPTLEEEPVEAGIQGYSYLHCKFEASIVRPCFKGQN